MLGDVKFILKFRLFIFLFIFFKLLIVVKFKLLEMFFVKLFVLYIFFFLFEGVVCGRLLKGERIGNLDIFGFKLEFWDGIVFGFDWLNREKVGLGGK